MHNGKLPGKGRCIYFSFGIMLKKNNKKYLFVFFLTLTIVVFLALLAGSFKKPTNANIILITVDALRPDHLSCYGYGRNTSPNIDKLSSEGIKFTQAISQGAVTVPSLFSLMTSLYPYQHGSLTPQHYSLIKNTFLAEILKNNNYATCAIVAHEISYTGIFKGFDSADANITMKANEVTEKAISWLKANRDKKMFLWLHYFDTHGPYDSPAPYDTIYLNDSLYTNDKRVNLSIDQEHKFDAIGKIPTYVQKNGIDNPDYYVARYDGAISFVDNQVGILLKAVEKLGLGGDTIIILTADHGEYLGEHNIYFSHGITLGEQVIRVPLIIKYTNMLPAGKRFDGVVGHIDLLPTVLSLTGIRTRIKSSGINLSPFILKKAKIYPKRTIFTELWADLNDDPNKTVLALVSLRTGKWRMLKYIMSNDYLLFNLQNDPLESDNLTESREGNFRILKYKLGVYLKRISITDINAVYHLDENVKNRLKSFGYLQ